MLKHFARGLNLGGWISQYGDDTSRFERYLDESVFHDAARFGFDHVRVPFDYPVVYEHGHRYLDRAVQWSANAKLGLVLDLHCAEGYFFGNNDNRLFQDQGLQDKFVTLWTDIARHYKGQREDTIIFELLNEIVESTSERWNALLTRTIAAIREIDPQRWIMIGGRDYNAVDYMHELPDYSHDPRVIYTFHFYRPFPFTHQRAGWDKGTSTAAQTIAYPTDNVEPYRAFAEINHYDNYDGEGFPRMDIHYLEQTMSPALRFRAAHPCNEIYLGEYGVIEYADLESRANYVRDVGILCQRYGFGRAMWAWKMGFALVGEDGELLSEALRAGAADVL